MLCASTAQVSAAETVWTRPHGTARQPQIFLTTVRSLLLFGLFGPERDRATDDRGGGQRAEIPSVERVGRLPAHEEDLALTDDAAAVPSGQ
jgi:hypothetical protein